MGWVKGSDRNFEASQTEKYRKTKKDRRERRETSGGDPLMMMMFITSRPYSHPRKNKNTYTARSPPAKDGQRGEGGGTCPERGEEAAALASGWRRIRWSA